MRSAALRRSILLLAILGLLLSACVNRQEEAAATVEAYLQAIVEHDGNQVSNLSCQEWETDALTEVDSFQLVQAELEDVRCTGAGEGDDGIEVQCSGAIVTTYNNELSRIELAGRVYHVVNENGDWFVCGYR
jgi:hypothetical protein